MPGPRLRAVARQPPARKGAIKWSLLDRPQCCVVRRSGGKCWVRLGRCRNAIGDALDDPGRNTSVGWTDLSHFKIPRRSSRKMQESCGGSGPMRSRAPVSVIGCRKQWMGCGVHFALTQARSFSLTPNIAAGSGGSAVTPSSRALRICGFIGSRSQELWPSAGKNASASPMRQLISPFSRQRRKPPFLRESGRRELRPADLPLYFVHDVEDMGVQVDVGIEQMRPDGTAAASFNGPDQPV
jgi:hypothetical protein